MANIIEELIVIKLSRISKDESLPSLLNTELEQTIEQVVQELLDPAVIVEIIKG